jgi:hypothetical protein
MVRAPDALVAILASSSARLLPVGEYGDGAVGAGHLLP